MIIGICGKSGSGKSTLSNYLINYNQDKFIHCDIDKIGHNVLTINEVQNELIKCFGSDIIKDNIVDRKKLGQLVFNSREEMCKLSDITWKYMEIEIDEFLKENKDKIVILEWVLLPISKYFNMCDIKILLDIPYEIRRERCILRDNISAFEFNLREKASISFNEKDFDYCLKGNDEETIKMMVMKI